MSEVWRRYIHTAVEAQLRETERERERGRRLQWWISHSDLRHSNDTMAQLVEIQERNKQTK